MKGLVLARGSRREQGHTEGSRDVLGLTDAPERLCVVSSGQTPSLETTLGAK